MTFDDQLQRSLGALADRVRDEVSRACLAAGEAVTAQANEARDAAAKAASARAREEAEATARQEIARLERQVEEITAASSLRERQLAADVAAWQRLIEALRVIDRAPSLSDILDALIIGASREAARVGLFLVRQGALRGWRFVGFGPDLEPARSFVVRADESGVVGEAVRTGLPVSSAVPGATPAPVFAQLPGIRLCLAVPVIVSGEVVAVLYADQGADEDTDLPSSPVKWPDTLELFARHVARCIEAATAIKAVHVLTAPPETSASAVPKSFAGARASSGEADHNTSPTPAIREPELRASS
ncbi:MAG: GAF domain-containing protein [Acidobacteriota bacterium]